MFARPFSNLFDAYVAQDHGNAARAKPLRDPGSHDPSANHGGVHNFFDQRLRTSLAILFSEEKIANKVARRFISAEFDDRIDLECERFIDRTRQTAANDIERAGGSLIRPGRGKGEFVRIRWSLRRHDCFGRRFPFALQNFSTCDIEKISGQRNLIDEAEPQRLFGGIEFSFRNNFRGHIPRRSSAAIGSRLPRRV